MGQAIKGILGITFLVVCVGFLAYIDYGIRQDIAEFTEGYDEDSLFTIYAEENLDFYKINGVKVNKFFGCSELKLPAGKFYDIELEYKDDGFFTETESEMTYTGLEFSPKVEFTFYGTESGNEEVIYFEILQGNPQESKQQYDSLVTSGVYLD